jgi:dihydrofolate reductase
VFVLTHHVRPSFTKGETTFHFLNTTPADALEQAKAAADGKDVRLGGGTTVIREFLDVGLIDTLHVAVSPIELGRGVRLWDSPDDLLDRYHCDVVPSSSGVTHYLYWRK